MPSAYAQPLAALVGKLIDDLNSSIEDLSDEELHALALKDNPAIGFHAWHVLRTVDNIVHFVFFREQPVWTQQRLDQEWGLPKVDQGTGMERDDATAMRFPGAAALVAYGTDVRDAARAKIEAMDDDFLLGTTSARVGGQMTERRRIETLGQVIIAHGSQHFGQIQVLRQLLGKPPIGA